MNSLPDVTHAEWWDSPGARYYQDLMKQAESARSRSDHLAAQQFASKAHKWTMDEIIRMRRLNQAEDQLAAVTKQLETAWDRDRSCTTLEELRERHPETRRLIAAREAAEQQVRLFAAAVPSDAASV